MKKSYAFCHFWEKWNISCEKYNHILRSLLMIEFSHISSFITLPLEMFGSILEMFSIHEVLSSKATPANILVHTTYIFKIMNEQMFKVATKVHSF